MTTAGDTIALRNEDQSTACCKCDCHGSRPGDSPANCGRCRRSAKVRCSTCKLWYCSQQCQENDWQRHKADCAPPPPLENLDGSPIRQALRRPNAVLLQPAPLTQANIESAATSFSRVDKVSKDTAPPCSPKQKEEPKKEEAAAKIEKPVAEAVVLREKKPEPKMVPLQPERPAAAAVVEQKKIQTIVQHEKKIEPVQNERPAEVRKAALPPIGKAAAAEVKKPASADPAAIPYDRSHVIEMKVDPGEDLEVCVLNIMSPFKIFVIPADMMEMMTQLQDVVEAYVASAGGDKRGYRPAAGNCCVALSADDEMWYRAVCRSNTDGGDAVGVFFPDFGFEATVPSSAVLPTKRDLLKMPYLANRCVVDSFADVDPNDLVPAKDVGNILKENLPQWEGISVRALKRTDDNGIVVRFPQLDGKLRPPSSAKTSAAPDVNKKLSPAALEEAMQLRRKLEEQLRQQLELLKKNGLD